MSNLLTIEKHILQSADSPTHGRILRRIVAYEFPEAKLTHAVFFAYTDKLVEEGYLKQTGTKYNCTEKGNRVIN